MSAKRKPNALLSDVTASATEMTGAMPRPVGGAGAASVNDVTVADCIPCITAEDPAHSPLLGGSARPYGVHNPPKTTPDDHPAR